MKALDVKALRRIARERQGELRAVPMERIRHEMRRAAARHSREAALRRQWADYGHDGERLA